MKSYRISADALLRLASLADGTSGANAEEIVTILRDVEPIDAPAAEPTLEGDAATGKIAKPE